MPPGDPHHGGAAQRPGKPERDRARFEEGRQTPERNRGIERDANPAEQKKISRCGQKPAQHRVGKVARDEAEAEVPEHDAGDPREACGERDHHGDGCEQYILPKRRPRRGDRGRSTSEKDRGHVLRMHDGAPEGKQHGTQP